VTDGIPRKQDLVRRHGLIEMVEHWAVALSGIMLIVTGLLELPVGRRYYITEIPGFSWADDFFVTLSLHYAAAIVFVAVAFFHLFYHGLRGDGGLIPRRGDLKASIAVIKSFFGKGEEPPFGKYLPEQRLAYMGMAALIVLLVLSGLVKTYMNLLNPQLSRPIALTATWIHNGAFFLFVLAFVAHIAALLIKPNRPLLRGMFTGYVGLDYARKRHPLWMDERMKKDRKILPGDRIEGTIHSTGSSSVEKRGEQPTGRMTDQHEGGTGAMILEREYLPYASGALEPTISGRTVDFHYGKHHAQYEANANKLIAGSGLEEEPLEIILKTIVDDPSKRALFNNAAQLWNHTFYWKCLTPGGGGRPGGKMLELITASFGGFDRFREAFHAAAMGRFGSGWAWLVMLEGKLDIMTTADADTPVARGIKALLTVDVWEHAYYLDYQNRRADYLTGVMDNLVNWDFALEQLEK